MWTCEQCGTTNIAAGLLACPHCGQESEIMAKSTKAGGLSGWPDGTDSSASTELQAPSLSKSEPESVPSAPMTDGPSDSERTESSTAPSTDGDQTDWETTRETDDGIGEYEAWRREDLFNEATGRGLQPPSKAVRDDLIKLLREDDQTTPL